MDVTVHEAKTHLSRLLRLVEAGETVTIHRGRERVAVLTRATNDVTPRRMWGTVQGSFGDSFDDDLPEFADYR